MSLDLTFDKIKETAKYSGCILISLSRYKQIYSCIRGFPLDERHEDFNDETAWMRRGVMFRELVSLEKEVFVESVETLMNRSNAHLVIDDELIGYRAKNIKSETLSTHKTEKEGQTGWAREGKCGAECSSLKIVIAVLLMGIYTFKMCLKAGSTIQQ